MPVILAASQDIFAPASDPDLYFRASPYGERSEDWPGYQTNYPAILVKRALENFAEERELDLELAALLQNPAAEGGARLGVEGLGLLRVKALVRRATSSARPSMMPEQRKVPPGLSSPRTRGARAMITSATMLASTRS